MGTTLLLTLARVVRGVFGFAARRPAAMDLRPLATTRLPKPAVVVRPLRVLRVVDAAHGPATAGRMVISGRMADVCAELDRLAAAEAAAA